MAVSTHLFVGLGEQALCTCILPSSAPIGYYIEPRHKPVNNDWKDSNGFPINVGRFIITLYVMLLPNFVSPESASSLVNVGCRFIIICSKKAHSLCQKYHPVSPSCNFRWHVIYFISGAPTQQILWKMSSKVLVHECNEPLTGMNVYWTHLVVPCAKHEWCQFNMNRVVNSSIIFY